MDVTTTIVLTSGFC